MPGFDPKSGHVRFVVNKVALGQVFLRVATSVFPPVSVIPPMLYTHLHLHVLPEGQTGEVWLPSKKLCSFGKM
jgi:hypothetical protein